MDWPIVEQRLPNLWNPLHIVNWVRQPIATQNTNSSDPLF